MSISYVWIMPLEKVTNFAVLIACRSFCFHSWATSLASGSSGLGAESSAWIESNTVRICRAGDHLSFRISLKQTITYFRLKIKNSNFCSIKLNTYTRYWTSFKRFWRPKPLKNCLPSIFCRVCQYWDGIFLSWSVLLVVPLGTPRAERAPNRIFLESISFILKL